MTFHMVKPLICGYPFKMGLKGKIALLLALGATLVMAPSASFALEKYWRVSIEDAKCFLENLPNYARLTDDPVIVFLKACPVVERVAAIQRLQRNVKIPELPQGGIGQFDEVLVFQPHELKCLKGIAIKPGDNEVLIPTKPVCE